MIPTDSYDNPSNINFPLNKMVAMISIADTLQPLRYLETERWGTLSKALRVVGWVLRFIYNGKTKKFDRVSKDLSCGELLEAKILLHCESQRVAFLSKLEVSE